MGTMTVSPSPTISSGGFSYLGFTLIWGAFLYFRLLQQERINSWEVEPGKSSVNSLRPWLCSVKHFQPASLHNIEYRGMTFVPRVHMPLMATTGSRNIAKLKS